MQCRKGHRGTDLQHRFLQGDIRHVQYLIHIHIRYDQGKPFRLEPSELRAADAGRRVGAQDKRFCFSALRFGGKVCFVQKHEAGDSKLAGARPGSRKNLFKPRGICDAHAALVGNSGKLGQNPAHVGGVGQAAGFHEHNIRCIRGRLLQRGLKLVQTAGAENRAVADLIQRRVQLPQQRAVHAGASEFVDDEPQPPAGKLPGKIFEESGFPCTQKTGDEIQFHYIAPFLAEKRL